MFNRRTLLVSSVGIAATGMSAAPEIQSSPGAIGGANIAELYSYFRDNGFGKPALWYINGDIFYTQDQALLTPLIGYQELAWNIMYDEGDGTYTHRLKELAYFSDLQTGEIIDGDWENPVTGETVQIEHMRPKSIARIKADGSFMVPPFADKGYGRLDSPRIIGDRVSMLEFYSFRIRPKPDQPADDPYRFLNTTSTYQANVRDMERALRGEDTFVPTSSSFSYISPARPWMGLPKGDVMRWNTNGFKIPDVNHAPRSLVDRINMDVPSFLSSDTF